jgi:uncharacterized protein
MKHIQTFFLRVAARCNLNCNYCYVFKHSDQSWKTLPPFISTQTVILFTNRLRDYINEVKIKNIYVVFHGGEPLLIGESILLEYADIIREGLRGLAKVELSLQTNGVLLSDKFLKEAKKRNIGISLSVDGPKGVHDKNRKMHNGAGSFDSVMRGIEKLQRYPQLFQGVIGVIDPNTEPEEIFRFYKKNNLYNIDLLLPDANYDRPPIYRDSSPNTYTNWLIKAFDVWFISYQCLCFKTYENILKHLVGVDTSSDFFGSGELSYITIETDGSYHTSDILKVAYENASAMGISLFNASICDAINSNKVKEYNNLLKQENLPQECKLCEIKGICAGGCLPHRYSQYNRFNNPTIYCAEIKALVAHAKKNLTEQIARETRQ